jgi:hypothetical protein
MGLSSIGKVTVFFIYLFCLFFVFVIFKGMAFEKMTPRQIVISVGNSCPLFFLYGQ